jgi:Rrf2 family protein
MRASRKVDYALRAMAYLASAPRDRVTLVSEIAEAQDIPKDFLSKILKDLVNRGLVRSHLGPGGGYSLARDPSRITFREVHEAIEGPLLVMDCGLGTDMCSQHDACTQLPVWREIERTISELLDRVTMEDIKRSTMPQPGSPARSGGQEEHQT